MSRAVWLVIGSDIRRPLGALAGLTLVVAVVGAVVMAAAAGARRTDGSLDRFLVESATHDARIESFVMGELSEVEAIEAAVAAQPGVVDAASGHLYVSDAPTVPDFAMLADPEGAMFRDIDRPQLVEGRLPAADAADEIAVKPSVAASLGVALGDEVTMRFFSPEDCVALAQNQFLGFNGPSVTFQVVGIFRQGEDLQGSGLESGVRAIGSPAFVAVHQDDACTAGHGLSLRLGGDADVGAIQEAVLAAAPGADPVVVSADEGFVATTRSAIDVAVTAVTVFAAAAAAAGALALAQAVSRQVSTSGGTLAALHAVGLERRQRVLVLVAPPLVATAIGLLGAVVIAVLVSPVFPIGVAREAEPDLGVTVDMVAIAAVAIGLLAMAVTVAVVVGRARSITRAPTPVRSSSPIVAAALKAGVGPTATLGLRFAYERSPDRTATPVRTAILGVLVGVTGVVATLVMVSSLAAVREAPDRWGWTFTAKPDNGGELPPDRQEALLAEPDLEAVARLETGSVTFGETVFQGAALTDLKGDTPVGVVEGRVPVTPAEVGLGAVVLDELGVEVGDEVTATGVDGAPVALNVVGQTVSPMVDIASPGEGAVFTAEGLRAVTGEENPSVVLTYRDGVDGALVEADLAEAYGLAFPEGYARPQEPGRLANMGDNHQLVLALGGFFAVLALVGLTHALVVSTRRQRTAFAVLQSMGLRRAQLRRAVVVQSAAIVLAGAVVGVPLGLVVGRTAWRAAVGDLGMLDTPTTPGGAIALVILGGLVVGGLVAGAAGWAGARRGPAQGLRAE